MPLTAASSGHPFVILTNTEKVDSETRRLIRSHVMRGKNRRKSDLPETNALARLAEQTPVGIPRSVGSDIAFLPLPDVVEPNAAVTAIKLAPIISKARYALEPCLIFDKINSDWLEHLSIDASCTQTAILMAQTYFDSAGHNDNTFRSPVHFYKAVQFLRRKLSLGDLEAQISDSTIFAMVNLATHARLSGEDKSAKHHIEGIHTIIKLRGGLESITSTKLLIELFRCDISLALHTDANTVFFSDEMWLEPHFSYSDPIGPPFEPINITENLDDNLARCWELLRRFCSLVNLSAEAQGKLPWECLLDTMTSVVYRLLYLAVDAGSPNEALRFGLLAFSTQIFLHWKHFKITHAHLTASYRNCLMRLRSSGGISSRVVIWLLTIGAISVFESSDDSWLKPWLKENIDICGIASWVEMQEVLESFMWIRIVQEKPGKEVFKSIMIRQT